MDRKLKGRIAKAYLGYLANRGHCFGALDEGSPSWSSFFPERNITKMDVSVTLAIYGETEITRYLQVALAILEFEFVFGHRSATLGDALREEWGNVGNSVGITTTDVAKVMEPILTSAIKHVCNREASPPGSRYQTSRLE